MKDFEFCIDMTFNTEKHIKDFTDILKLCIVNDYCFSLKIETIYFSYLVHLSIDENDLAKIKNTKFSKYFD